MLYDSDQLVAFDSMKLEFDGQVLFFYQQNKPPISLISSRDFVDKKIMVKDGDITYVYTTFLPDEHYPHVENVVRGYGIAMIQRFTPH